MASLRDREAWSHILKLYKGMPHLWDRNNSNYGNRSMMRNSYTILTCVYRQKLDKDAKVNDLKKKIDNLRTTYFRESRKVKEHKERGEIYTPSLWYFDKMLFLDNSKLKKSSVTTDTVDSGSTMDTNEIREEIQIGDTEQMKQKVKDDEYWNVMGKSIGFQLRDLNKKQYAIVLKIISDIIYLGKLDKLSETTHVIAGYPGYTNSSASSTVHSLSGQGSHVADTMMTKDEDKANKGDDMDDDFDEDD